jgi:hypothetical protein
MVTRIREGDCVRLADGRIGRVRRCGESTCTIRVRRTTSKTHQFVEVNLAELERVDCPRGWMSPEGYSRYLTATLSKMRERMAARRRDDQRESMPQRKR